MTTSWCRRFHSNRWLAASVLQHVNEQEGHEAQDTSTLAMPHGILVKHCKEGDLPLVRAGPKLAWTTCEAEWLLCRSLSERTTLIQRMLQPPTKRICTKLSNSWTVAYWLQTATLASSFNMPNSWSSHWQQEIIKTSDLLVVLFKEMELSWAMKQVFRVWLMCKQDDHEGVKELTPDRLMIAAKKASTRHTNGYHFWSHTWWSKAIPSQRLTHPLHEKYPHHFHTQAPAGWNRNKNLDASNVTSAAATKGTW